MAALRAEMADSLRPENHSATRVVSLADGSIIPVDIRRLARGGRLAIRLSAKGDAVVLTLPLGVSERSGLEFLHARLDWIAVQWAKLPPRIAFSPGAAIPVLGVERRLVALGRGSGRVPPFRLTPETIEVTGGPEHLAKRTQRGLVALSQNVLAERSHALAAGIGKGIRRISIGDPRSRWGSCSSTGNLRFSWRLILAPEAVLDYVVAHEVAHLAELNHSARFWRLVERLAPGYQMSRVWLRANGRQLLRYG